MIRLEAGCIDIVQHSTFNSPSQHGQINNGNTQFLAKADTASLSDTALQKGRGLCHVDDLEFCLQLLHLLFVFRIRCLGHELTARVEGLVALESLECVFGMEPSQFGRVPHQCHRLPVYLTTNFEHLDRSQRRGLLDCWSVVEAEASALPVRSRSVQH